jgi:hypothetical protein
LLLILLWLVGYLANHCIAALGVNRLSDPEGCNTWRHGAWHNKKHDQQQTYKTWLLEKNSKTLKIVYIHHSK